MSRTILIVQMVLITTLIVYGDRAEARTWSSGSASAYNDPQPLAFGGRLTGRLMGVAHKTLPRGTRITIMYGKRKVRVRVLDRGPYIGGRVFDLMPAVYRRLGFRSAEAWGVRSVRWRIGWR